MRVKKVFRQVYLAADQAYVLRYLCETFDHPRAVWVRLAVASALAPALLNASDAGLLAIVPQPIPGVPAVDAIKRDGLILHSFYFTTAQATALLRAEDETGWARSALIRNAIDFTYQPERMSAKLHKYLADRRALSAQCAD